jgi:hypothetical protein
VRPTKIEIKALVDLLEQDCWETPEQVAEACIKALDHARAERTTYCAVMQFGEVKPFYLALGPYAGNKSAAGAARKHPGATEAFRIVVVPLLNDEGLTSVLRDVG